MLNKISSNETKLMLYCARTEMNDLLRHQVQEILKTSLDWTLIIKQSFYNDIAPLIYYNLNTFEKQYIPKPALAILKTSYYATSARNIYFWKEFCSIQDALHKAGIKIIPLKGIVLANTLYHNLGVRPMLDIDILVKEEDIKSAEKCILQIGYQKQLNRLYEDYWRMYQAHFCFYNFRNKVLLELHWKIAPSRPNILNLDGIWKRTKLQAVDQVQVLLLSPEDTLLSLYLHIGKNISSLQYIKLKNLCDINELIAQHGNIMNWNYIADKLESWRIRGLSFYLHRMTNMYLNTPWPVRISCGAAPHIVKRKIMIIYASRLRRSSRLHAALLMALMIDSLKDLFALVLIGISMIYRKNRFLIFHSKIR